MKNSRDSLLPGAVKVKSKTEQHGWQALCEHPYIMGRHCSANVLCDAVVSSMGAAVAALQDLKLG